VNKWIVSACATLAALSLATGTVVAQPKKPTKPAAKPGKSAQAKCPVCGMFLASKPTQKSTVAVRLKKGGPVMYCCAGCKMPASVLVKGGKAGKTGKMGKM